MHRFSYMSNPRRKPYSYLSIVDVFGRNTSQRPTQEILIHRRWNKSRISITNENLDTQSTQLAKYLYNAGIKRGDTVGIFGPNTIEWAIGELAILKAGAVSVHISLRTTTGNDAMEAIFKANCKMLIIDPGLDMEMRKSVDILNKHILSFNESNPGNKIELVLLRPTPGYEHAACLSKIPPTNIQVQLPRIYPEDPAIIFASSGSTGEPKLIQYAHFSLVNSFNSPDGKLPLSSYKFYNDRPFYWLSGTAITYLLNSCTRVFIDTSITIKGSSLEYIWQTINEEACTGALLMPYVLQELCAFKKIKNDDYLLKTILTLGQVIDDRCREAIGLLCTEMTISYGATEAGYTLFCVKKDEAIKTGKCGKPVEGTEIKLIGKNGDTVPKGQEGEICIRSRVSSQGYFNDPLQNKKLYRPGGWICSGDIGFIDTDGDLVVVGRTKDLIFRGVRKVTPGAIEDVIRKMPGLKEVIAIPVPDKRLVEEVCICFTTNVDDITEKDVMEFCGTIFLKENSMGDKGEAPTYCIKMDEIPILNTGKPDRSCLKEMAVSKLGIP